MAFPTGFETSTTLDVMLPEIWGERLNDILRSKLVMANFFTNRSAELAGGGDVLHTPNLTEMSANSVSNGTAVTLNNATETDIDLAVNNWYEVSFMILDKEVAQVKKSYYLQERYMNNAAFTVAKKLETALAALFLGFSNVVGTSVAVIADSDIRKAIGIYEGGNNDPADGAFFFDTKVFWNQLQNIDKFSLAVNAPVQDPVSKRPTAKLYGYDVWVSNNIQYISETTGRANALASKDALHYATASLPSTGKSRTGSMGVRLQTNYIPEYLGFLSTADLVYGVIENRDAAGVYIKTST